MKKVVFGLAALVAISASAFAGTETYQASGKEGKTPVETPTCFSDHELQVGAFGTYEVGNGQDHAGPPRNHAWGGGVEVNYFFMRYFGLGAEGSWTEGRSNAAEAPGHNYTQFQSVAGNLFFRYPIDSMCLAPYLFLGGGATMDGSAWAVGHVGVGVEYRVVPNKVGIFADGRWNYYGDRFGHDVQNNFQFRAGARLVF